MPEDDKQKERILTGSSDAEGGWSYHAVLTPTSRTDPVHLLVDDRPVIPIVFLPGVMGSNLWQPKSEEVVWQPDNEIRLALRYAGTSPEERQGALDTLSTEVYWEGDIYDGAAYDSPIYTIGGGARLLPGLESTAALKARGWGSVAGSVYHEFMADLQRRLNSAMSRGKILDDWLRLQKIWQGQDPDRADWERNPKRFDYLIRTRTNLPDSVIEQVAGFHYEVWACGYNWLRSNVDSANAVANFIRSRVLPHYAANNMVRLGTEGKVLLVTHSMGGLVARRLCADEAHRDLILGVVHGAMPANGAVESYVSMRQGVDGKLGIVLGGNAATFGAVFSQCIGGLELLPFGRPGVYNPKPETSRVPPPPRPLAGVNRPGVWLFVEQPEGFEPRLLEAAAGENVYEAIYKSEEWYGLLPKHNEDHFDPAKILRKEPQEAQEQTLRKIFRKYIDKVRAFHESVVQKYHPLTYAFWAAAEDCPAVGEALWHGELRSYPREGRLPQPKDTGKGVYLDRYSAHKLDIVPHSGDGTVAMGSWCGDLDLLKGYWCLGAGPKDTKGFDHQGAFKDARVHNIVPGFIAEMISKTYPELRP